MNSNCVNPTQLSTTSNRSRRVSGTSVAAAMSPPRSIARANGPSRRYFANGHRAVGVRAVGRRWANSARVLPGQPARFVEILPRSLGEFREFGPRFG
jgi:hypothetical protein